MMIRLWDELHKMMFSHTNSIPKSNNYHDKTTTTSVNNHPSTSEKYKNFEDEHLQPQPPNGKWPSAKEQSLKFSL